jgi:hypothetical protein
MKRSEKIFPDDTQWAIAAQVPASVLADSAGRLPSWLHGAGSRVVEGTDGWRVLLAFGGSAADGQRRAEELARSRRVPVFLLDFDDDAPGIRVFGDACKVDEDEHPSDWLEERGVVAPGYDVPPSPVSAVGLVEGVTPAEALAVEPNAAATYVAHPRGTLVTDDENGLMTLRIAKALDRRAYDLMWHREEQRFWCDVYEPGQRARRFAPGRSSPNHSAVDDILGETTLDGILRVLEIPRELLR